MKKVLYLLLSLLVACQGNIVDTEILTPEKKDQLIDTKKENMAIVPINGPADFQNISNILGVPVTYDEMALCTHANINIWSEFLPFKYSFLEPTIAERKKYRWGYFTEFQGVSGSYVGYNKPVGGEASPYRIGDFRGYDSLTPKPEFECGANRVDGQNTTTFIASFTFPLAYDFSNIPALVNGYKVGCIINNNTNYGIILNSDDGSEFYGSKVLTGFIANSFSYKFGLVPTNALGEPAPISSMIEFAILDNGAQFGAGSGTVIVQPDETQPTYMDLLIDLPSGVPTDVSYSVVNYSPGVSRLNASFKVLENRPSGSFGVYVTVAKISDGTIVYPETLERTITILSTNSFSVNIDLAYASLNYHYVMVIQEL